jgi:exopolyphosphatase/guanosine-5'-triphosphate,3'-diphosphate pyrophosphatase
MERIREKRVVLGLGAEIERQGAIPLTKLVETAAAVTSLVSLAYEAACARVEVLVTSPGRQAANRNALEHALAAAAPGLVRFVAADEEARLAFCGALACTPIENGAVAVCDVGGGSSELAVGSHDAAQPLWTASLDLGSLRVTQRHFPELPLAPGELEAARASIRDAVQSLRPPGRAPRCALAAGGTARALRRIVGSSLGRGELTVALDVVTAERPSRVAERFGVPAWRAQLLPGGTLLFLELQHLLGTPLTVAGGGLREGAALELLSGAARAA